MSEYQELKDPPVQLKTRVTLAIDLIEYSQMLIKSQESNLESGSNLSE